MKPLHVLEKVKRIPFFTGLLFLILLVRLYQVLHKNPSFLQHFIQKTNQAVLMSSHQESIPSMFFEKQWTDMEKGLNNTKQEMHELKRQVITLQNQVTTLHQKLQETKTLPNHQVQKESVAPSNALSSIQKPINTSKVHYSLHAIVPGRAWLNTQDGKIITVSVGSILPGLGIVRGLDAHKELVYLDTGIVIGLHPDHD